MSVCPYDSGKSMKYRLGQCAVCTIVSLIIGGILTGFAFLMINVGVYRAYCDSIIVDCNVSRTGYVYTWSPKDNPIICSYAGETFVEDNDWDIIDCYYDDEVNKCPSDECIEPESMKITMYIGVGLMLGAIGLLSIVFIGMLIYVFVDWCIIKYRRSHNTDTNHNSDTVSSYSDTSIDTVNSSDGRCNITVDSYSGDDSDDNSS